jgi:ABC-type multidrug transport system fused ATPase/permease subunit
VILAVDFQGGIENAWLNVATFVPKLAAALLILIVGYFVARIISRILDRILERVGFDRVVERGGLRQALARSKYDPSDILAKVVYWTIMLFVLQLAFGVFGSNPISDLLRGLIAYLPNIIVAILIIVIAAAVARAVSDLLSNLLGAMQGGQLIARGAGIAILVFAAFAALDQLQIAPRIVTGLWYAILAAVVGSVIVAVGGGGIRTMQRYWERTASQAEQRGPELRAQARASAQTSSTDYAPAYDGPAGPTQGASITEEIDTGRTRRRGR